MNYEMTRRRFMGAAAMGAAGAIASGVLGGGEVAQAEEPLRGKLRKAMIVNVVTEKTLTPLKEAGFEGVEVQNYHITEAEGTRAREIAEKMGMRIHSVMRGWAEFNHADEKKAAASLEETRQAMRAAKWYGADDILLVPCRIDVKATPEPWEFEIEFDDKSGHCLRVVAGDNAKFAEYIAAQNRATDLSRAAIEKLIPLAEELKVIIAVENVWNNLWVQPAFYKNFVASFKHEYVKSYFDIGNHVKYSKTPVQEWIKVLGPLIVRLHIKDYKLNADGHYGKFCHPRDGSIDWPAVRRALSDIGYENWASIEDGGLPLGEFMKRFELIESGK